MARSNRRVSGIPVLSLEDRHKKAIIIIRVLTLALYYLVKLNCFSVKKTANIFFSRGCRNHFELVGQSSQYTTWIISEPPTFSLIQHICLFTRPHIQSAVSPFHLSLINETPDRVFVVPVILGPAVLRLPNPFHSAFHSQCI